MTRWIWSLKKIQCRGESAVEVLSFLRVACMKL